MRATNSCTCTVLLAVILVAAFGGSSSSLLDGLFCDGFVATRNMRLPRTQPRIATPDKLWFPRLLPYKVATSRPRSFVGRCYGRWPCSLSLATDNGGLAEPTPSHQLSIEYCTGCRWGLRANWMAQELLTTFADVPTLQAVTLVPSSTSGRFLIQLVSSESRAATVSPLPPIVLWDRTVQDGFPELKVLKQLLRNQIDPTRYLGHSDNKDAVDTATATTTSTTASTTSTMATASAPRETLPPQPIAWSPTFLDKADNDESSTATLQYDVLISYGANQFPSLWRAAYLAVELLSKTKDEDDEEEENLVRDASRDAAAVDTSNDDSVGVRSITLVPRRRDVDNQVFQVDLQVGQRSDGTVTSSTVRLWDRAVETSRPLYPEAHELKQRIVASRNQDRTDGAVSESNDDSDEMDGEQAEKARAFFGVA